MVAVLSSPEICKSPDLPLSMSGRPATVSIPGSRPVLTPLEPAPASLTEEPETPVPGGRDLRALRLGRRGPWEHQLRVGLVRREGGGEEAENKNAEPGSHRLSLEALEKKGKARAPATNRLKA